MLNSETMNHLVSQNKSIGIIPFEIRSQIMLNEQVQLKNVTAVYENGKINIQWQAITEGQDFIFIIERSDDGKLFEIIGISRSAKETKNGILFCEHQDEKPQMNFPLYRIIYVEKSKVIFGKTCKIENFESMVIDRINNTGMILSKRNQYIQ